MATKILVVDDDISLTAILQERLLYEGFEVNTAADGHEGYLAYLRHLPDVILTDIQMPGESGLELMQRVWMHNPEVRAIYMSGEWTSFQPAIGLEKRKIAGTIPKKTLLLDGIDEACIRLFKLLYKRVPQSLKRR